MGFLLIALGLSGASGQVSCSFVRLFPFVLKKNTHTHGSSLIPMLMFRRNPSRIDLLIAVQVFLFVSISKFGALTTSIIGLSRKVTTLLASIYFYGHYLNGIQISGLLLSITAMCMNFVGKSKKGEGHGPSEAQNTKAHDNDDEETQKMLNEYQDEEDGDIELSRK